MTRSTVVTTTHQQHRPLPSHKAAGTGLFHALSASWCVSGGRSAELRNWLLQHEALLFKYRFAQLSSPEQVSTHRVTEQAAVALVPRLAETSLLRSTRRSRLV